MFYECSARPMSDKTVVIDNEYINNINWAMVMIFDTEHNLFGKEFVIEDGNVTQVITPYKIIKKKGVKKR